MGRINALAVADRAGRLEAEVAKQKEIIKRLQQDIKALNSQNESSSESVKAIKNQLAKKEAELSGRKVDIEILDLDKDEFEVTQSVKEEVDKVLNDDYQEDELDMFDPNKEMEGIEGIDY